jgi:hypothetical protein
MCVYTVINELREVCVQGALAKRTGSMGKAGAGAPTRTPALMRECLLGPAQPPLSYTDLAGSAARQETLVSASQAGHT